MSPAVTISAQLGPQTGFLRSPADICIYGGAAGGGKTIGLILEPLRHATRVANFTAVFFRRSTPQITNPGGLWDESQKFYHRLGGTPHIGMREWRWRRGGKIKFAHLQFDSTVYDWQGAQIALICFDELTHFTAHQFFYMVSRNRSTCGVKPYIRATCNPDADSWVADFLAWWIDPESGLPIPERAGVLRYYVRVAEKTIWADRPEELTQYLPQPKDLPPSIEPPRPISVTFIPATVFDNPILLRANPDYYAWLLSLPTLERERLLGGNWKIRPAAGMYFKREWCALVDEVPAELDVVRIGISPPPKRPSSTTRIGRSASSSAATGQAVTTCWIWCECEPIPVTSNACCATPPNRTANRPASGLARIRGRPARARRSISCARSTASP
jgi:hypothetical protein